MDTIKVEQAVFASSDRGRMKGYQLVSRSAGVDKAASGELSRWAPTQFPSIDPEMWTINFFPVVDDLVAVTRTVLGGPEYSARGGTQVVTLMLLLKADQFAAYAYNPVAVARTAMTMGYLKLPLDMTSELIPAAELPREPLIDPLDPEDWGGEGDPYGQLLEELTELLSSARRVAVVGLEKPLDVLDRLIPRLPLDARRKFSFTTGLAPAVRRPFQAHFLPSLDSTRRRTLEAQHIVRVDAK
jgi:hypothetical protein